MSNRKKVIGKNTVVHVPLSPEQKQKLQTMAENDHRKLTDFIRLLIDQEWNRRNKAEPAQSAPAA